MQTSEDTLVEAGATLRTAKEAQADREPGAWAARVDQALAAVEAAVAQHDWNLRAGGGGLVEVSGGRVPSPGMDRQVVHLRENLAELRREAEVLRSRVREALDAGGDGDPGGAAREGADHLLAALERYVRDEANFVLESTTTEVGAGD